MTAKHRKGKGNHKHEDNFFKNEVTESEVRSGAGSNYALQLVLFLMVVIGGAIGAWFCLQQHQTLTHLTDSLMGMQVKMVKLQSSHEEVRQSSGKHVSESLETRLNALEESYALAQKQVGMALATAEQLRTSDLPAQVLSLHTEMKTRLAEMQQATVSLEQLSQLQTTLKGKSEEFEGVRIQVAGLASQSAELSQKVEVLSGSLGEAESKLEQVGQVSTLSATLDGQATELLRLKEQLDSYQAQLEAKTLEIATVRELLEREQSQRLQQASVEEQIDTLRQSLQDQTSAAKSLTAGLEAQLEDMQKQINKLVGKPQPPAEPEEQAEEETAPSAEEEAAAAVQGEELQAPPADVNEETSGPEVEAAAPAPVEEDDYVTDAQEIEEVKEDQTEPDGSEAAFEEEVETAGPAETTGEQVMEVVEGDLEAEGDEEQKDVAAEGERHGEDEISEGGQEELAPEEETVNEEEQASEGEGEEQAVQEEGEGEEPVGNEDLTEDESLSRPASPTHSSPLQRLSGPVVPPSTGTMQAFVPRTRLYLTPVRDEEAESQRKAKSRHARQTRRSTQGVTLTDLKEAQRTNNLSPQDRQTGEGGSLDEGSCLMKGLTDDRGIRITEETAEVNTKRKIMDEQGNTDPRLETLTECSISTLSYSSTSGSCVPSYCNNSFRVGSRWWKDENQNLIDGAAEQNSFMKHHQRRYCCEAEGSDYISAEHERLSRYDSSGESAADKALGRTSSYTRREARLASVNKQEQDSTTTTKDYKKMYAEALNENERLKSRLQDSKQELAKIRSQLEKVTQRHDRLSERSSVLDSEKREKHALERKVSNMEEELKILTELKSDNQRLKDENGALIRVISKLSK